LNDLVHSPPITNAGNLLALSALQANISLAFFAPLQGPLFKVTVFFRWQPEEQPGLRFVNVVEFITFSNFELLHLPPFLNTLQLSPNTVLYTALCHCSKPLTQPLEALKILNLQPVAACRTFYVSIVLLITSLLALDCLKHATNKLSSS
jgi:hypothetical protein